jgi:acetyl-CoA carboxylase biotin carboxyl carrier protein
VPLDFNEIRQLLATIAQTDIAEVTLKSDDFEITVRKAVIAPYQILGTGTAASVGVNNSGLPVHMSQVLSPHPEMGINRSDNTSAGTEKPQANPTAIDQRLVEVPSPIVGTFYRAPAPGEAPFVEVGDRVKRGQAVCIVEAMKVMNEIETEVSGQVMEILVQNGDPVEYNQPLMRINPD